VLLHRVRIVPEVIDMNSNNIDFVPKFIEFSPHDSSTLKEFSILVRQTTHAADYKIKFNKIEFTDESSDEATYEDIPFITVGVVEPDAVRRNWERSM
jgi:hypothetical protein